MKAAIIAILVLQTISVCGFILFVFYLKEMKRKYKSLESNLQTSIRQVLLDKAELESQFEKATTEKKPYPDLFLN